MTKLTNPTDDQLNVAFAETVAGWTLVTNSLGRLQPKDKDGHWIQDWDFTQSADAVLPWLEKTDDPDAAFRDGLWSVVFYVDKENNWVKGEDKSLPRAAVIALLRAHGVEIEFCG